MNMNPTKHRRAPTPEACFQQNKYMTYLKHYQTIENGWPVHRTEECVCPARFFMNHPQRHTLAEAKRYAIENKCYVGYVFKHYRRLIKPDGTFFTAQDVNVKSRVPFRLLP